MVRRNPYKMKLKKKDEERKKEEEATRVFLEWERKIKNKKKRETYADSIPGVVFFFCSKQSI